MTLRSRYSVIIIGAGPTGLVLANLLGIEGISTLLIERNMSTVAEPRAVSIDDETLRTLQAAGLIDTVLTQVVQGYGAHYYDPRGRRFAIVQPMTREFGYHRRNAFRQPILESQLREGLARFSHVDCRFQHRLETLNQDEDSVTIGIRTVDGSLHSTRCDFLVGTDGASSMVRESIGTSMRGNTFNERWLIVDLLGTPDRFRHTRVYCDPERPAISLPGPGGTRRYEFMLHPHEQDENLLREETVRELVGHRCEGDRDLSIVRKTVYTFHARIAERWCAGRVFLAGDAAHLSPPFAGQGMNSGVRDALNLSWKLSAVLRGELGRGLLDSYEIERKPHAWALIEMAIAIGRIMMPRSKLQAFFMQLALRLLAFFPPARDYLMQMKFKPKPRFRQGFVVPDGASEAISWSGRLFIQPLVELPDGRRMPLDEATGKGFALLLFGEGSKDEVHRCLPQSLRAAVIRVVPQDYNFPLSMEDGVIYLRDCDGAIETALKAFLPCGLLLRPDRHVAAVLPLQCPEDACAALTSLVKATHKNAVGEILVSREKSAAKTMRTV